MSSEPRLDNAFSKFGEKREIRDGTIVGQIFFVKGRFFEKWADNGVLKRRRERARTKRHVDDASDCRQKSRKAYLKEPGWYRVKMTLLIWRIIDKFENLIFSCRSKHGENRRNRRWMRKMWVGSTG